MHIMFRKQTVAAARVFSTLVALVVLGGCAMKGDVRDLQVEIRALAARQDSLLTELRAETLSTQDTLRTQSDQMFDFRGDINQSIRQIAQSLARLEALAGENQRGIAGLRDQMANMGRMPDGGPPMTLSDSSRTGRSGELVGGTSGGADQLWDVASQQYFRGSFSAATMAFQQFLEEHPDDARAAQAHYNLADILVEQDRPDDALEAFQRIQELYPTSDVVPNAMFRIGYLHNRRGDTDQAKAILERLVNTYPDAIAASLARDLLEQIG